MDKNILLIGRNPMVLVNLASALTEDEFGVQTTHDVEQAGQQFNGADFDLVAFGRGVDEATNAKLRVEFTAQHPGIQFVDGLAPVTPLLVKQIKQALINKLTTEKAITAFTYQLAQNLQINVTTVIDGQLTVDLYQLDAVHHTEQKTLISQSVKAGNHTFLIRDLPDIKSTINFLVAEIPNFELAVLPLQ